jgi:putative transposase
MVNKGIKLKLYPTKVQEAYFKQEVGNQRFLWNKFLYNNIKYHNRTGEFKFYYDMSNKLPNFKEKYEFLKLSNSQALQQTLKDLEQTMKNCFNSGFGFPNFKKYNNRDSFRVPQQFKTKGSKLWLPKVGWIRFRCSKSKRKGKIKNVTVSRDTDNWYASVCVEFKPKLLKKTNKKVGIDVGSVRTLTKSDGHYLKAFRNLDRVKLVLHKIKVVQRQMSWKQECWKQRTNRVRLEKNEVISNSWLKLKFTLQKLYEKLRNLRRDFLHKASYKLVKEYDVIAIEDLRLKNLTKNNKGTIKKPGKNVKQKSGLNRNLLSNSLGTLVSLLEYKCKWYGKESVKVNPKFTSQICSSCGFKSKTNRKSQSEFECNSCGFKLNADHNAALNILALAS